MTRFFRARPALIFIPSIINIVVAIWLLEHSARLNGVIISTGCALGVLVFMFFCIKSGFVLGVRKIYEADSQPGAFWQNMVFCFVIYLFFTGGGIILYLQDVARG